MLISFWKKTFAKGINSQRTDNAFQYFMLDCFVFTKTKMSSLKNGYDLDVYGLENGQFYIIHIPAIVCILISLVCAIIVVTLSFKTQGVKSFFSWTKSERFVVYLATCDGLFNICHTLDHFHYMLSRDHVRPLALCQFYGFMLAEFITAQNLMVNVAAINAFILIFFRKHMDFGRYDWKLLFWTFGVPFICSTVAGIAGQLGPNGAFCYFDGVKGVITNILFTTVPLLLVLVINTILYALTWYRINTEAKRLKGTIGKNASTVKASHRAAKTMSLFVAAFFVQWWAMALYGIWQLIADVPQVIFQFVTTFSNIGGILNGAILIMIKRRKKVQPEADKAEVKSRVHSADGTKITNVDSNIATDHKKKPKMNVANQTERDNAEKVVVPFGEREHGIKSTENVEGSTSANPN